MASALTIVLLLLAAAGSASAARSAADYGFKVLLRSGDTHNAAGEPLNADGLAFGQLVDKAGRPVWSVVSTAASRGDGGDDKSGTTRPIAAPRFAFRRTYLLTTLSPTIPISPASSRCAALVEVLAQPRTPVARRRFALPGARRPLSASSSQKKLMNFALSSLINSYSTRSRARCSPSLTLRAGTWIW